MDDGIDYLFISNADNLAATVDSAIVQHLDQTKCPFLIELTPKMDADTKGGTVVTHQGQFYGKLHRLMLINIHCLNLSHILIPTTFGFPYQPLSELLKKTVYCLI